MTGRHTAPFVIVGAVLVIGSLFGIPYLSEPLNKLSYFAPAVIVLVALSIALYKVWRDVYEDNVALRERLSPTIRVFINEENKGILEIPATRQDDGREIKTKWVQFCVSSSTGAPLEECEAWLTRLARINPDDTMEDLEPEHIHCRWSMENTPKITIPALIIHHANILILHNDAPTVEPQFFPQHIHATREVQRPGDYRIDVVVTALGAPPEPASFVVRWHNYDDVQISQRQ